MTFILISQGHAHFIDLTHPFDKDTIFWPTEKGFLKQTVYFGETPKGYFYSAFKFCTPEHGGTHIDAPIHFSKHGLTVDQISPEHLIGEAVVIDVHDKVQGQPDYEIKVQDIQRFENRYRKLREGDIVLFRTDWSQYWNDKKTYLGSDKFGDVKHLHFPGISKDAAIYLVKAKIKGLGIDTASMDPGKSKRFYTHRIILGANLYGLENLDNLNQLAPVGTFLIIAPMKIKGGSGGPTRVFAKI
ncbi:MAG: cyclase family protein [Gammaproteobacteria bacterium]|nr:cyclase family protein [Gammaproteobacteria bacterium]